MTWSTKLAAAGLVCSGLALMSPPWPYPSWEWIQDVPGPLLLIVSFVLGSRGRRAPSWLAAVALLALLAIPGVPYAERSCSDVPKPYTMDFCDEVGADPHPFGWVVVLGRAYGYGDLGSLTWRAPWWTAALAASWLLAFAAIACRWRPGRGARPAPHD